MPRRSQLCLIDEESCRRLSELVLRAAPHLTSEDFIRAVTKRFRDVQKRMVSSDMTKLLSARPSHAVFHEAVSALPGLVPKSPLSILVLGSGPEYAGMDSAYAASVVEEVFPAGKLLTVTRVEVSPESQEREPAGCYDVVMCNSLLHFLPDLDLFFRYVRRLVAPGGCLLFAREPNARFWKNPELRLECASVRRREQTLNRVKWILTLGPLRGLLRNSTRPERTLSFYDAVNEKLQTDSAFRARLTPREIARIVDPHLPSDHSGDFTIGYEGFDWNILGTRYLTGYELVWRRTSDHLGRRPALTESLRRKETALENKYPDDGCFFTAIWRKS